MIVGEVRCCGRPFVDEINSCTRSVEWLVVGIQVSAEDEKPIICALTSCERHRVAVEKFQCTPSDPAHVFRIDTREQLAEAMQALLEGGEVWMAQPELMSA